MKKIILMSIIFFSLLTGCSKKIENQFITVEAKDDEIIIDTKDIDDNITFVSYEVDGITIQFIVVRGSDGNIRIAFNTCQVCNPSPNAYFIQKGNYIECQNCGTKFKIDDIGIKKGGCNPTPVEEKKELEDKIIISKDYVESFKTKFQNWNGPIE